MTALRVGVVELQDVFVRHRTGYRLRGESTDPVHEVEVFPLPDLDEISRARHDPEAALAILGLTRVVDLLDVIVRSEPDLRMNRTSEQIRIGHTARMGLFSFLVRRQEASTRQALSPIHAFNPPARPEPVADWEIRLDRYARKVSRLLLEGEVPTYSQRPMWDVTFPFWVISVGISEGYRTWWTASEDPFPRFFYRGGGLLLTVDGQLIDSGADSIAVIGKSRPLEFDERNWSSEWTRFAQSGWARDDRGYWKPIQIPRRLEAEEWERRFDPNWRSRPADGRGTSAALTQFLQTQKTMWPHRADI